jgi:hypothetical protein
MYYARAKAGGKLVRHKLKTVAGHPTLKTGLPVGQHDAHCHAGTGWDGVLIKLWRLFFTWLHF